jgi:hypothetical protein
MRYGHRCEHESEDSQREEGRNRQPDSAHAMSIGHLTHPFGELSTWCRCLLPVLYITGNHLGVKSDSWAHWIRWKGEKGGTGYQPHCGVPSLIVDELARQGHSH